MFDAIALDYAAKLDSEWVQELTYALYYRAWEFIIPMAGAVVGSFLGIIGFYICRWIWDISHSKKVKLSRGLDDAKQMVLEARAELAGELKENDRLKRIITNYEKRWQQHKAEGRAIIELAKRRAK